ncbi:restriction endonuclease subunit S [Staphylococcus epidermidis]|uniref:restriction endonuclease subunit S n=1 Tax=Staphylococcus epidermidis TaxID=1282 RepID=UPI00387235F2
MEYNTVFFGNVAKIKNGYAFKSKEFKEEGIPVIKIKNIISPIVDIKDTQKVSIKTYEETKNFLLKKDDILISLTGSGVNQMSSAVGKVGKIEFDYTALQNQRVGKFELKYTNSADLDFLFYYFLQPKITNYLVRNSTGSANQANISSKLIETVKIPNFSLKKQKSISKFLNQITRKIEINKKIIANLEELSQTLFKRWFVDFEFPDENGNPYKLSGGEMVDSELGEIPKGWNVKNLDDIANYVNGLAMQKFKPTDNQNSLPVVKIKELKNGSTDENSNRCTSEIPDKVLINDGDIIFSWSATLLVKMWCGGKAGLNQHLFKVSSDKYPKWFYYYWTKRYIDYFIGIANDKTTTMGHINRKHLSHAKILIPNDRTLEKFSRTFDDLLEKELSVSKECKRLIELRDTLLPKLMSGELEIPDDVEVNTDELSI